MKLVRFFFTIVGLSVSMVSYGASSEEAELKRLHSKYQSVFEELGVGAKEYGVFRQSPVVVRYESQLSRPLTTALPTNINEFDPISNYQTAIPRGSQPAISGFEKHLLSSYLNAPASRRSAEVLAIYHVIKAVSVVNSANSLDQFKRQITGESLKHLIIAQYFLHRATRENGGAVWASKTLTTIGLLLKNHTENYQNVSTAEDREAHHYFIETFNYREENRFEAYKLLLSDYAADPGNLYTVFQLTALNLWVGGEADYDDPTVLYNFVVGSYFSIRAIEMAEELENAWKADPAEHQRFRMASILGGLSVMQRRWLAVLHEDTDAVAAIDDEHREWQLINRAFHSFTVGMTFFEEEENFLEGMAAWLDGLAVCNERNDIRTCMNRPRFSFNPQGMIIGLIDFMLKNGDLEQASQTLTWIQFSPDYDYWDLGHDPVEHREANLVEIFERYQNDDPADDPLHFMHKRKKWGTNTVTCQTCHQAQSKIWPVEEKDVILLPPEDILSVDVWPAFSTTWYGTSK